MEESKKEADETFTKVPAILDKYKAAAGIVEASLDYVEAKCLAGEDIAAVCAQGNLFMITNFVSDGASTINPRVYRLLRNGNVALAAETTLTESPVGGDLLCKEKVRNEQNDCTRIFLAGYLNAFFLSV